MPVRKISKAFAVAVKSASEHAQLFYHWIKLRFFLLHPSVQDFQDAVGIGPEFFRLLGDIAGVFHLRTKSTYADAMPSISR